MPTIDERQELAKKADLATKQNILTPGTGITIVNDVISSTGGSTVTVSPADLPSPTTQIGSITVDGDIKTLFAPTPPTISVTQTQLSGDELATIIVNGTPFTIYAPEGTVVLSGTSAPTAAQGENGDLYVQYTDNRWAVKFRTLLAQNTSHLNQLVGYGITGVEPDGSYRYAPLSSAISYLNIAYGTKVRANLFLGYMKNLGANEDLYDFGEGNYRIYMKGGNSFTHLNSVYRVAPSVSYNLPHFNLGLEYEWTACTFGDLGSNGSILLNDQLHNVANHRICLLVKYNF